MSNQYPTISEAIIKLNSDATRISKDLGTITEIQGYVFLGGRSLYYNITYDLVSQTERVGLNMTLKDLNSLAEQLYRLESLKD